MGRVGVSSPSSFLHGALHCSSPACPGSVRGCAFHQPQHFTRGVVEAFHSELGEGGAAVPLFIAMDMALVGWYVFKE